MRDLKFQRLDEEFFYDKIKAPIIPTNNQSKVLPLPRNTATQIAPSPIRETTRSQTPLPPTPGVDQQVVVQAPQQAGATGLTATETALLSDEEKAIRLRQKGLA